MYSSSVISCSQYYEKPKYYSFKVQYLNYIKIGLTTVALILSIMDSIHCYGYHHHLSVLPKGRSFTASLGTKAAVLPKAGLPPQIQEPRLQFYQG